MKTTLLVGAAAVMTAIAVQPAAADSIDRRQANQDRRIEQGVRSGQITRHEARKLEGEQDRISAMERRARSDGFVDPWERRQIKQVQNHASRHIAHEKHDGDRRWNRWWHRRWWQ